MNKSKFQIFVENLTDTLLSIIKLVLQSDLSITLPQTEINDCVILGNGPSLNPFLEKNLALIDNKTCIAVNNFTRTNAYDIVRPQYYVITSPEHFIRDVNAEWHEDRMKTFKIMCERTTWKMILFVPKLAKKSREWKKHLQTNQNIKIIYFNNTPIEGFMCFKRMCFSKNWGMPRPHNVLIPSLMLAINLGFKTIYIAGADHSWTREVFVTDSNEVLLSQKHFYDKEASTETSDKNKPTPKPMYHGATGKTRKLHEVLIKFYYSFRSYWDIKAYAEKRNTSVFNITPGSFIDAFDRIEL